jgi:hypothetical protein
VDTAHDARTDLRADCSRCVGLCCVALAFARSADFAFDKPAGDPCVNLATDDSYRCRIHPRLRERGFKGCTVFDCFGAGQQVTQRTFGGASWTDDPTTRAGMFAVFPIVRQLHELLWYLREALLLPAAARIHPSVRRAIAEVETVVDAERAVILATDIEVLRAPAAELLREAARLTREAGPIGAGPTRTARSRIRPGADLLGANLRGADLRGAELRGALLIASDLRDADLSRAELIGADLRDARLDGADLRQAIYLTQVQVNAASGDARTKLPAGLERPSHWR